MGIEGAQSVNRALALLLRIIDDGGGSSLAALGREIGLAPATSYRLAGSLRAAGLVVGFAKGRLYVGPELASRRAQLSLRPALVAAARPILGRLARAERSVAHIGVLENDMVTYLVREGAESSTIFSEEGSQLEAYCSGIGKMLLASLPELERETYLAAGPFVALTDRTITDPAHLRAELAETATRGFACDRGEAALDLNCTAVAIRDPRGAAIAALSLSRLGPAPAKAHVLGLLRDASVAIEEAIFQNRC